MVACHSEESYFAAFPVRAFLKDESEQQQSPTLIGKTPDVNSAFQFCFPLLSIGHLDILVFELFLRLQYDRHSFCESTQLQNIQESL